MIYTIGYQKFSIEDIENIIVKKDIGLLVDVRSHPYSRNPAKKDFNKNRLIERFVFPTDVGMNRCNTPLSHSHLCVPHRRGDEPK